MTCLMAAAKAKGFKVMQGEVLATNTAMLKLTGNLGFIPQRRKDDPSIIVVVKTL